MGAATQGASGDAARQGSTMPAAQTLVHFAEESLKCSTKASTACSGACAWDTGKGECVLSPEGALASLAASPNASASSVLESLGGALGKADVKTSQANATDPFAHLVGASLECSTKMSDACRPPCTWNDGTPPAGGCELDPVAALTSTFSDGSDGANAGN